MSDEQPPQDEKTEEPTEKRRKDFREKGEVAKSQELAAGIMLLSGTLALWLTLTFARSPLQAHFQQIWSNLDQTDHLLANPTALLTWAFGPVVMALIPTFLVLLIMAVFTHLVQIGPLLSWKALQPNPKKLNPIKGVQRIFFSKDTLANLVKTLVKVGLIGGVAIGTLRLEASRVNRLVWMEPEDFSRYLENLSLAPLLVCGLVMIVVGVGDFLWQRHRMEEKMKMTRKEAKREHKENEGDPLQKGVRKQKHRELLSMNRLIEEVPRADVILNNPTHVSVALRYRPEDGAPVVLVKGVDHKAKKIREIAADAGVVMVTNPPLARALHKEVEEGEAIPPIFYEAVAEVLAFVFKEQRRE